MIPYLEVKLTGRKLGGSAANSVVDDLGEVG